MSDVPPPPPGPPPPPPGDGLTPPPGYVAYGNAPTPMTRISRVKGLSTAIMIVVGIAGVGSLVNALLTSSLRTKAEDFLAGSISESEFNDSVVSFSAFSAIAGIGLLAGAVLVMIWMFRITANLRAFGQSTTWHPLFAIFGWFLPPLVLYVIPFLMLREQWQKSAPPVTAGVTAPTGGRENPALWIWFVAFGLLPLLTITLQFDSINNFGDTGAEAVAENLVDADTAITLISGIGSAVAAAAWIVFVRQLTARHRAMTGES
ncbi:MAG: DUF4328 domain-containing protein [Ilumatobacter sp.]|nr:DUF4328 domain-containing protein [Ilumatobacter sp.]